MSLKNRPSKDQKYDTAVVRGMFFVLLNPGLNPYDLTCPSVMRWLKTGTRGRTRESTGQHSNGPIANHSEGDCVEMFPKCLYLNKKIS